MASGCQLVVSGNWQPPIKWWSTVDGRRPVCGEYQPYDDLLYRRMATALASLADEAIELATKLDDVMHHHKNDAV